MSERIEIYIEGKDGLSKPLQEASKALGHLDDSAKRAGSSLGGIFKGLVGGLGQLGLAGLGISALTGAVTGLATGMIAGNAEFERYETQFGVLLGSAKAAKERLEELTVFGATTPFELPGVVVADKILQGFGLHSEEAAKKFGFSGKEIRRIAGDVAAGSGAAFDQMAGYIGKFASGATGEAIMRFQELGIVNREQLANMGLEFAKSGELMSPLPKAMNVLLTVMKQKYGGMMDAQSKTFEGMMSNLTDWIGNTKRKLMAPLFEVLKDKLQGVLEFLGSPAVTGALDTFAEILAGGMNTAIGLVSSLGSAFKPIFDGFGKLIGIFGAFFGYLDETNTTDIMGDWFGKDIGPRIDEMVRGIKGILNVFGSMGSMLGDTFAGKLDFSDWIDALSDLRRSAERVVGQLGGIFGRLGETIVERIRAIDWGATLNAITEPFRNVGTRVLAIVTSIDWTATGQAIIDGIAGAFEQATGLVTRLGTWLGEQWRKIDWPGIWGVVTGIGAGIATLPSIVGEIGAWIARQWSTLNWSSVWSQVTGIGAGLLAGGLSIVTATQQWLGQQWAKISWSGIWSQVTGMATGLVEGLASITASVQSWLGEQFGKLAWSEIWASATGIATGLATQIQSVDWAEVGNAIGNALNRVLPTAIELAFSGANLAGQMFSAIRELLGRVDWWAAGEAVAPHAINFALGVINKLLDVGMWWSVISGHPIEIGLLIAGIVFTPTKLLGPITAALGKIPLAGGIMSWMVREISALGKGFLGAVGHILGDMAEAFVKGFLGPLRGPGGVSLLARLRGVVQAAVNGIVDIGETFYLRGLEFMEAMGKALAEHGPKQVVDTVRGTMKALTDFLLETVPNIFRRGGNIGEGIIDGIKSGINAGWQALRDLVGNLADDLLNAAKRALGIGSPSKEFFKIGEQIINGLVAGIESRNTSFIDAVRATLKDSISLMESLVDRMVGGPSASILGRGASAIESLKKLVPSAFGEDWVSRTFGIAGIGERIAKAAEEADVLRQVQDVVAAMQEMGMTIDQVAIDALRDLGANLSGPFKERLEKFLDSLPAQEAMRGLRAILEEADLARQLASTASMLASLGQTMPATMRAILEALPREAGGILDTIIKQLLAGVIPGFQHGGTMVRSGLALIGERGPELLALPGRAQVIPLSGTNMLNIDYDRLAAALSAQPIVIRIDGEDLVVRGYEGARRRGRIA